ncbi:MAG: NAD-dependent epimerase/dehydratase family protein [Acidimicrobiia bacterium]|nr:NAD-dependent epimerase/dehydratase family protein [Acidimicrobiia bacterium]
MTDSPAAPTIAVTGASGLIGSRLVPELVRSGAARVVGLDVRDPVRGATGFEPHLVDVAGHEIESLLAGVETVVHLAAVVDPIVDDALMARANVEGTRRVLAAAAKVGVRKFVRVSTAAVYGAWATNPVPLTEDSPLRPNPGFAPAVHAAEVERLIYEWHGEHPDVVVTVLRAAPVLGAGADHLFARLFAGNRRLRIRREGAPIQVVHVDDLVAALVLVVQGDHPGVFDVAAPGWLASDDVGSLMPRSGLPAVPLDVMRRLLTRSWRSGVGDVPPSVLPYVLNPWVIATDRLESIGWQARHTNEETLLETHESLGRAARVNPKIAAAAAGVAAAGIAAGVAANRSRRS